MSGEHRYLERNDQGLADNIAALRMEYESRFVALENDIASLKHLVQNQSRVIGEALQSVMGNGSTVPDPNPEDKR